MRKGSTEMWWIIIGAVIALVVLIILLVLFTGKTGGLEGGLTECGGKGGVCASVASSGDTCPSNTFQSSAFSCSANQVCCIGVPKKCNSTDDKITCGKGQTCKDFGAQIFYCVAGGAA